MRGPVLPAGVMIWRFCGAAVSAACRQARRLHHKSRQYHFPIRWRPAIAVLLVGLALQTSAPGADAPAGRLLIIGGGMRRTSSEIYERLIDGAGGRDKARIVVVPTASRSLEPAQKAVEALVRFGLPADRAEILDLTPYNAREKASDPKLVAQIGRCTGLFIAGGDQRRVTAALIGPDGTERPVLTAMRDLLRRGGIIAGSSAGAAVQSEQMLAVSGLPADLFDEGYDALDFGLSSHDAHRGLRVSRGLGFFHGGIVDQHFNQYRGRLGRLARAATERGSRFAFGIDENTAIDVAPDGTFEVVGAGAVTVVDAGQARCTDGPLGCRLTEVLLSHLEQGDRFDPRSGKATIHPAKHVIEPGKGEFNGNHLIPDIAGEGAVAHALITGLAENTRRTQVGVMLKHHDNYAHGYRCIFSKTDQTRSYGGDVHGEYTNAIVSVRLDIEPIVGNLRPSADAVPKDIPDDDSRPVLQAIWFRGLLLADEGNRLRPAEPITRGDLAAAVARTIHIEPARTDIPAIANADIASPLIDELEKVIGAGLFVHGPHNAFDGNAAVTRREAAAVLARAYEMYRGERLPADALGIGDLADIAAEARPAIFAAVRAGLLPLSNGRFNPGATVTRKEAAQALYRIIGFSWKPPVRD
ncbi:MAG: cyanophycinase [Planctomycetia bacterium]|nr:cyanophycinase [Planctomycetia bacterium]